MISPETEPRTVAKLILAAACAWPLAGCGLNLAGAPSADNQPGSVLTIFGPPSPAVAAAWAADQYDADKRYRGTLMLANAPFGGEDVYLRLYEAALNDGDARVQSAAIRGLALHGGPEHVAQIVPLLRSGDRLLRWEAARALQRLHDPVAVPALLRSLVPPQGAFTDDGEPEPAVRIEAAIALGQYTEARVIEGLIAALDDRNLMVNDAARSSLRLLTGQDFGLNMRAWVAWRSSTDDLFAGQSRFEYPVFERGRRGLEWINPFANIPNEIAAAPAGMPDPFIAPPTDSTVDPGESVRHN